MKTIDSKLLDTYGDITLRLLITDDAGATRKRSLKLFAANLDS